MDTYEKNAQVAPGRRVQAESAGAKPPVFIDIALVAVLRRTGGGRQVLLTQRPGDVHLPDVWELPGGKLKPGETPATAAVRELREETGIVARAEALEHVATTEHRYPDRAVRLHAFAVQIDGESGFDAARVRAHRWVDLAQLPSQALPGANAPITAALVAHFG